MYKRQVEEGIVPGGGTALLSTIGAVKAAAEKEEGDKRTGMMIVARAMEEPIRQIATNAGVEGSGVVEKILREGKVGYGYNAYSDEYCMMADIGVLDPTKVARSALQNASSIAAMLLTTESLVCDIPEPPAPVAAGNPEMMY